MDVITEPTTASRPEALQAKTTFHQDRMYFLSPFKIGHCGIPSRLCSEEEDQGHYKYSLATTVGGDPYQRETLLAHTHTRTDLLSFFFPCTGSSSAPREANPPQSRSRVLHRKVARNWVNYRVPFPSCSST